MKVPVYTIRIVHKSGYVHEFDAYYFKKTPDGFSWESVSSGNHPTHLDVDSIEAIYQVGTRMEEKNEEEDAE
jgi:hypothetical protein